MDIKILLIFIHVIGVVIGVGSAITTSFLFFRAMKDRKISEDEASLLDGVLSLLWIGFFLTLVSGLGFFALQYIKDGVLTYFSSGPFLAKMTIMFILYINAILFHYLVYPKMRDAASEDDFENKVLNHALLFSVVGSVSLVSWVFTLVIGTFRSITPTTLHYEDVFALFFILCMIGTAISYLMLRSDRRSEQSPQQII